MGDSIFLSQSSLFEGDYHCILHSPKNEFTSVAHYLDFYEVVIYLGNAGVFHIEGSEYLVRRGDIVLIDMFKPHALVANKNSYYERFSVSINLNLLIAYSTSRSNLLDIFHKCSSRHPIYHLTEQELQKYLRLMDEFSKIKLSTGQDILEKALVHQMLSYIYSDCYSGEHADATDSRHMAIVSQLLRYINRNLSNEFTLAELAAEVNYSEYYICRLFKKMTGKTLTTYIQEKRIHEAACLLRSYDSINQAAEQVGFNNYSYFYKTFKKFMGCGPAEYQAQYRTEAK